LRHSSSAAHGTEIPPNARILFCNGQVGARLDGTVAADPTEQLEVIFERIRTILVASSMTFEDVVKFTVYVRDKSILDDYFRIRGRVMGNHNPPATLLVVKEFPRSGVEVEIRNHRSDEHSRVSRLFKEGTYGLAAEDQEISHERLSASATTRRGWTCFWPQSIESGRLVGTGSKVKLCYPLAVSSTSAPSLAMPRRMRVAMARRTV
jgi:enamine deaminase RidA (YjgF/YER057c/UK114 family)